MVINNSMMKAFFKFSNNIVGRNRKNEKHEKKETKSVPTFMINSF